MTLLNTQTRIDQLDTHGEGASPRLIHACERAGITTLGELAAEGAQKFYVIKHCGHRTVAEARAILRSAGLAFRDEVPVSPTEPETHYSASPGTPTLCGAVKPSNYPLLTTTTSECVTCEKCTSLLMPGGLLGGIHALFHGSDLGCAYGGMSCPARMKAERLLSAEKTDTFREWRPIETAPKDGSYILLRGDSGYTTTPYRVAVGCWIEGYRNHWLTHSNDAFTDDGAEPTHWQPLPAPPKETQ